MSANMLTLNKHVCRVPAHPNGLVFSVFVTYSYYFIDTFSDFRHFSDFILLYIQYVLYRTHVSYIPFHANNALKCLTLDPNTKY